MNTTGLAALTGATLGGGLFLAVYRVLPTAPPNLTATLNRLTNPRREPEPARARWFTPLLTRALASPALRRTVRPPRADLRVLGRDIGWLLGQKLGLGGVAVLLSSVVWIAFGFLGLSVPLPVPMIVTLAAAILMFHLPDLIVRNQAKQSRADFTIAASAYLDLVALERAAQASPIQALEGAAELADGWAFGLIRDTLSHARREGVSPWRALSDLARELDVPDLRDLADIIATANEGAAIYDVLVAKSRALRHTALTHEQADANAQSERLVIPLALMGIGTLVLAFFPAVIRLLGT